MTVYSLNPLTDSRWPQFLADHPQASIFHTREWLGVLRRSYGYEPIAFTTSPGATLANAVVFCRVRSWLTGSRLVSLPFSDHCQPLIDAPDLEVVLDYLQQQRKSERLRYIELRPLSGSSSAPLHFSPSERFHFHSIDLRPNLDAIYEKLHSNCIRRKIRRAEREQLVYESGRTDALLQKFRHLFLLTRRRHQLPPQPPSWFQNILHTLGEFVTIHVASKNDVPVASIMTFTCKRTAVYKYGCSDARFNAMGGTPLLFWKAIQRAKSEGIEEFDLGRSGDEDAGLIDFKHHLGGVASELTYYRNPPLQPRSIDSRAPASSLPRLALARLPDPLFSGVGQLLYRHMG
jgi:lipid II:glycine glycyltransferase (peptidoglycan interpeptide bridge formation enzyme)